jgi:hypothetical protein
MSDQQNYVRITLRIPVAWTSPKELVDGWPEGYRVDDAHLITPCGTKIELGLYEADDQFASIFVSSCRQPPLDEELEIINNYTQMLILAREFPLDEIRGSLIPAQTMLRAGAAAIVAGGGGVLIDNSGLCHGGSNLVVMAEVDQADATSFAYVSIVRATSFLYTLGMSALGLPDIMIRGNEPADGDQLVEMIQYMCANGDIIGDGHILADEVGPRFQCEATTEKTHPPSSPMHNPFGMLRLVSMTEIAERN